jgi:hypothetical protein
MEDLEEVILNRDGEIAELKTNKAKQRWAGDVLKGRPVGAPSSFKRPYTDDGNLGWKEHIKGELKEEDVPDSANAYLLGKNRIYLITHGTPMTRAVSNIRITTIQFYHLDERAE